MQVLLFSYPAISRTICQSFRCSSFEDGTDEGALFLTADMSIGCKGDTYSGMTAYASLCVLIYSVGIPLFLWLKLFKWRRELNPPGYEDEDRAIKARMRNKKMLADPLVSFAIRLRPHQWWYEVYTLAKRFALTSLVLAFPTLESYTVYVLAVAVCALLLDREWASHIDKTVSSFNHALNVQVLLAPLVC